MCLGLKLHANKETGRRQVSHYGQLYMSKETLESSFQGGILKVIVKVATYSSFLRLIHETLIRDFNENCHVTLNVF